MNKLNLTFKATECNGWPKLRFFVDDDLIEDFNFTSDSAEISIPMDFLNGEYSLNIEFYGKTKKNTILDENKNIAKDQTVELVNMYYDNILLPDIFKWQGVYKFLNFKKPQVLNWGNNGVWQWKFKVPLLNWILDTKISNTEKYYPPEITNIERIKIEEEKIQLLKNQIDKL